MKYLKLIIESNLILKLLGQGKKWNIIVICLIFLLAPLINQSQQVSYPYGDNDERIYAKLTTAFQDTLYTVRPIYPLATDWIVDCISIESLEIERSDTIVTMNHFPEEINEFYLSLVKRHNEHFEIFGVARNSFSGPYFFFRFLLNDTFEVTQFDITESDYIQSTFSPMSLSIYQLCVLNNGNYLLECFPSETYLISQDWQFVSSLNHSLSFNSTFASGDGRTMNCFGNQAIICDEDSCLIIDEELNVINTTSFNLALDQNDQIYQKSKFSNSSIPFDNESFLLQAVAQVDNVYSDNMIWKLSPEGDVIDSSFITKPNTDEFHEGVMLQKDGERIYGGSYMRTSDTDINGTTGDSLFFFAINENLDLVWNSSYAKEDFYFHLLGIEAYNNCLIAFGKEIPIGESSWLWGGDFFLLKYSLEELGLAMEDQEEIRQEFSVFPNPAAEKLSINTNNIQGNIKSIKVYDALGKEIYSKNLIGENDQRIEVNIDLWVDGLYVVKVLTKDRSFSSRFVKE